MNDMYVDCHGTDCALDSPLLLSNLPNICIRHSHVIERRPSVSSKAVDRLARKVSRGNLELVCHEAHGHQEVLESDLCLLLRGGRGNEREEGGEMCHSDK